MFDLFRRKPKQPTRMSHPIWQFYFEELRRGGESTDDDSVKDRILWSFAAHYDKKAEAMCREGHSRFGRGAIVHVPVVVSGRGYPYRQSPSSQYYLARTKVGDLLPQLGSEIIEALAQTMNRYDPDREFISAVIMTFDNKKPTPLDWIGWITIPY